jgi:hypothetical protein
MNPQEFRNPAFQVDGERGSFFPSGRAYPISVGHITVSDFGIDKLANFRQNFLNNTRISGRRSH